MLKIEANLSTFHDIFRNEFNAPQLKKKKETTIN